MSEKRKIELEYLLKTSVKVFENLIFTPSGLAEWFADDVNVKEDIYNFQWDGSNESARLISKKAGSFIRWQWLHEPQRRAGRVARATPPANPAAVRSVA